MAPSKKSQIAIFIMAAIILLVGVIFLFFFIAGQQNTLRPESERKIPLEAAPIKSYYDACVLSTAKEAFENLHLMI